MERDLADTLEFKKGCLFALSRQLYADRLLQRAYAKLEDRPTFAASHNYFRVAAEYGSAMPRSNWRIC